VAGLAGLIIFMTRPSPSTPAFAALFVPATLWAPFAGWMGYAGMPTRWRWTLLGFLLVLTVPFQSLVRVEGLAGDTLIDFAWRTSPKLSDSIAKPTVTDPTPVSVGPVGPDDSPQYFGPGRDGVWPNLKLIDWTEATPVELWRRPVGPAWSGIAVVGGYCFTQEQRGRDECVCCYRLADGAPVWTATNAARFESAMGGDGPRATPAIAGGRVYAMGATGRLSCLDAATGKTVWLADALTEFGGPNLMHGVCASPLIEGDRVIVCPPASAGPTLVAYHRETGAKLWAGGEFRSSYSSPTVWEILGARHIVIHNEKGLTGHDPADGRVLWFFPWTNFESINCSQPILDAAGTGTALVTTGYGGGAALVRVKRGGPDGWIAEEAWRSTRHSLKTKFTSAVLYEGHAYGLDDGILACLETATGRLRWKDGRYQHGQVIRVGDRLIVQAESGDLVMVAPTTTALKELGRISALPGKTWNIPVISGNRLIVRNDREMVCFELPAR
jgi:outer membrane protein assembly factor BamB